MREEKEEDTGPDSEGRLPDGLLGVLGRQLLSSRGLFPDHKEVRAVEGIDAVSRALHVVPQDGQEERAGRRVRIVGRDEAGI